VVPNRAICRMTPLRAKHRKSGLADLFDHGSGEERSVLNRVAAMPPYTPFLSPSRFAAPACALFGRRDGWFSSYFDLCRTTKGITDSQTKNQAACHHIDKCDEPETGRKRMCSVVERANRVVPG
jgi:hypothetical protein